MKFRQLRNTSWESAKVCARCRHTSHVTCCAGLRDQRGLPCSLHQPQLPQRRRGFSWGTSPRWPQPPCTSASPRIPHISLLPIPATPPPRKQSLRKPRYCKNTSSDLFFRLREKEKKRINVAAGSLGALEESLSPNKIARGS